MNEEVNLLAPIEYKPGKIYKVIYKSGLPAALEENIKAANNNSYAVVLENGKFFMFVETVKHDLSIFSKILVDDKVLITYNPYTLKRFTSTEQE